jgi:hypothetical protein
MSVQELKVLLAKANQEIARLKSYIAGLEDELRYFRGDSPVKPPPKPAGSASPAATIASESKQSMLSPDSRSKLPHVALIQGIA